MTKEEKINELLDFLNFVVSKSTMATISNDSDLMMLYECIAEKTKKEIKEMIVND